MIKILTFFLSFIIILNLNCVQIEKSKIQWDINRERRFITFKIILSDGIKGYGSFGIGPKEFGMKDGNY
jgi:L-alanine-DL-glutamate epimerase-like enolase superfamily enzyme